MEAIVTPLALEGSQKVRNPLGAGVYIPKRNTHGTIPTEKKCKDADLNERHTGHVPSPAQREKIFKLTQQVIAKTCSFADGVSLILDANGFETTKNVLDALSNAVRFVLPRSGHPIGKYFYNVEKKEIVFKRLILSISSTCKIVVKLAPQLIRLQALSKLFPHISLILDLAELGLNYKNFTKDGLTTKNALKIAVALCYHAISCATFAIAGASGTIFACVFAARLAIFFSSLVDEGMKDTALIMQPIDKLWFNKKLAKNVYSLYESACLDPGGFQHQTDWGRMICLSVIGLNLCKSAASAVVKLIRNSRETSETNITEVTQQGKEAIEDKMRIYRYLKTAN
ncbi:MAG: hypothetical protein LBE98_00905 [Puniceicoccales bacterium]|nr:hypothetical protein [Puniceicoccales bacterium]